MSSRKNLFSRTIQISAIFKEVRGLSPGDNVWLAGVKVGTVKSVEINSDSTVFVSMNIIKKQQPFIKKDASVYIGSESLVGSRIVIITPGKSGTIINSKDTLPAESPVGTHDIMQAVKLTSDNASKITNDLKVITSNIRGGMGTVGELLVDPQLAAAIKKTFLEFDITSMNTAIITGDLSKLAHNLSEGKGVVGALLTDTTHTRVLDHTILNVETVGDNLAKVSGDLSQFSQKLESNQGTLGVVLTDTAFANNLKKSMVNLQSGTKKIEQDAEAAQHNFLLRGYFKKQRKMAESGQN